MKGGQIIRWKCKKNMDSFGLFQATVTLTLALIEFHPLTSVVFLCHSKNVPCNKHCVVSPILNIKMTGRPHKPFSFSCQWQISLSRFRTQRQRFRQRESAFLCCKFQVISLTAMDRVRSDIAVIMSRAPPSATYTTRTIGDMYAPSVMTQCNVKFTQCFQLMQRQTCSFAELTMTMRVRQCANWL